MLFDNSLITGNFPRWSNDDGKHL